MLIYILKKSCFYSIIFEMWLGNLAFSMGNKKQLRVEDALAIKHR